VRDPRFKDPAIRKHEEGRLEEARALMAAFERGSLDALLRRWWLELLVAADFDDASVREHANALLHTLLAELPIEPSSLGSRICEALITDGDSGECRAAAILLGRSAAAAVGERRGGLAEFDRVVRLLHSNWRAIEEFLEELERIDPLWPEEGRLAEFSQLPRSLRECLGRDFGPQPSEAQLLDVERSARAKGVVSYIWGRMPASVVLDARIVARGRFLARRNWTLLVELAESLPLRPLRDWLWRTLGVVEDREAILQLLSASGTLFEADAWTGRVAGLEALNFASTYADALHLSVDDERMRSGLEQDELPRWFRQVVEKAQRRADARPLLLTYAAKLAQDVLAPTVGVRRWSSAGLAIEAIKTGLAAAPSADEMQAIARLSGSSGRREATYLVTGSIFGSDVRNYWEWYRALLMSADEGLCSHAKAWIRSVSYDGPASILAALPDPVAEWRAIWAALFVPDRERARFDRLSQTALWPSVHLIRVATALMRSHSAVVDARAFFPEVRAMVTGLLSNDPRLVEPMQPIFAAEALDLAPVIFGEEWASAVRVDLDVSPDVPKHIVFCVSALMNGGAAHADIARWCQNSGIDLQQALVDVESDSKRDEVLRWHRNAILEAFRRAALGSAGPEP
jgi:hypothetical protein